MHGWLYELYGLCARQTLYIHSITKLNMYIHHTFAPSVVQENEIA